MTLTSGLQVTINFGRLTDQQAAFLELTDWHLEACPSDEAKLRTVYSALGQTGRWFSAHWNPVPWDFVRPSLDIKR